MKYIATGGISFAIDYGTLLFLYRILKLQLAFSITVAFILALIINFLMNKWWTFESRSGGHKKHAKEAVSYLVLVGFNLMFTNLAIIELARLGIEPAISKILTVGCITLWNYYIYKKYIFETGQIID